MSKNFGHLKTEEYRDLAFTRLMESVSNRRRIQSFRFKLFKKVDIQPKYFKKLNLIGSSLADDIYYYITDTARDIIDLLNENIYIYNFYFDPGLGGQNVRDMLLPGEEELFHWDNTYMEYITNYYDQFEVKLVDPIGYYQRIYDFIIDKMTYDEVYDYLDPIDSDKENNK